MQDAKEKVSLDDLAGERLPKDIAEPDWIDDGSSVRVTITKKWVEIDARIKVSTKRAAAVVVALAALLWKAAAWF